MINEKHFNFGRKHSIESKLKMRLAKLGKPSNMKGKKTGKSSWMTGKHHTLESNKKNSEAHKGKIPWNKGIKIGKLSESTRLKQSITMKKLYQEGRWAPHNLNKKDSQIYNDEQIKEINNKKAQANKNPEKIKKIRLSLTGKSKSKEHILKASRERIKTCINRGYFFTDETKKIMKQKRALQKKTIISTIEIKIQNFLMELKIPFFTHHYIKEINHPYQCDIFIPSLNMVIECDGDYWHKYPIGNEIDHIRTSELIKNGFKVLRLWENEIKIMNLEKFKEKIN